jgi:recombination protein RecT
MNDTPPAEGTTTQPAASGILQRVSASGRVRRGGEDYLFSIRDEVAELLTGSAFEVDSYLQAAYRTIIASPDLIQATKESGPTVLGAVMLGAQLQLPIGGPLGQFYLTPRTDYGTKICVPMIGYRGFFELGYRSGRIRSFDYIIRRAGDEWAMGANSERGKYFDWSQFEGGEFDELDANGERRALTGVVALAYTLGATEPTWQFMSRAAIEKRRPRHWKSTPWNPEAKAGDNSEAMYVKTPHRELAKFLQLSIQSARAVEADEMIAQWNQATGAIETLDDTEGQHYDETPGIEAGGTPDEPSEAVRSAPNAPESAPSVERAPEKPADGRTAVRDPRPDSVERHPDDPDYEPWLARLAEQDAPL